MLVSRSCIYALILQRVYTTSIAKINPWFGINKKRFKVPTISTLRPEKLEYSDFLVLAGSRRSRLHTHLSLRTPAPEYDKCRAAIYVDYQARKPSVLKSDVEFKGDDTSEVANKTGSVWVPFPEYARGFLYLHQPQPDSGLPRSASSIRFRCVPSLAEVSSSYAPSPKPKKKSPPPSEPLTFLPSSITNREIYRAFKAGYDLTFRSGIAWGISVPAAASHPSLKYFRLQLLEDALFSESDLQEYETIYNNMSHHRRSNFLHTLNDVFPIKFDITGFHLWVAKYGVWEGGEPYSYQARASRFSAFFRCPLLDERSKYNRKSPYTGAAHVRLELAPGSNLSKPALSLRIVKITEPVKCVIPDYDGYVHMPTEGELVTRELYGKVRPWTCQLDPSIPQHSAMLALIPGYTADSNSFGPRDLP